MWISGLRFRKCDNCDNWSLGHEDIGQVCGVIDRRERNRLENFDVMLVQTALGHLGMVHGLPGLTTAAASSFAGGKSPEIVLELDSNSHQDKEFEIPYSNLNYSLDNVANIFSIALTYIESNLVPVPLTIAPTVTEPGWRL
ncbi:hypothetical protein V6N13_042510 [Hibiscus sabdariffa]|uniref:Uncharacterized protein n=1 Tax=Hibiscus sabdariffa TaxID=183260 RepID=A0ABR2G5J8_9ROSI